MRTGSAFFSLLSAAALLSGFAVHALPGTTDSSLNARSGLEERQTADAASSSAATLTGPTPHTRSYFYVGGQYSAVANANGSFDAAIYSGQMYVEHLVPLHVTRKYPLVMFHGSSMTGTNFLNTPDGRPGWADYFLSQGYEVYLLDQVARARSPWQQAVDGPQSTVDALIIEQRFTATELFNIWPQAKLHTQWPGNGTRGDPIFDNFYRSTVPSLVDQVETSNKVRAAAAALLDKIGPAIVMVHSQSGQSGWPLADDRPDLVKALVAIEPAGPPFTGATFPPITPTRAYGVSEVPLTFSPAISNASDLQTQVLFTSTSEGYTCIGQADPARKLVNVSKVPVLVVTSESGYHTTYDWCTVDFLRKAGVGVDHITLPNVGIHGNGHMMFMEKNNIQIADQVVNKWLTSKF
ncbi:alpha/beta-hydrolase [Agrocybe pediades]|nr:alpha/beta-hydrolase [Agrocybe pediades]